MELPNTIRSEVWQQKFVPCDRNEWDDMYDNILNILENNPKEKFDFSDRSRREITHIKDGTKFIASNEEYIDDRLQMEAGIAIGRDISKNSNDEYKTSLVFVVWKKVE